MSTETPTTETPEIPEISDEDIEQAIRIHPDPQPLPLRIWLPTGIRLRVHPRTGDLTRDERNTIAGDIGNVFADIEEKPFWETLFGQERTGEDPFRAFQLTHLQRIRKFIWRRLPLVASLSLIAVFLLVSSLVPEESKASGWTAILLPLVLVAGSIGIYLLGGPISGYLDRVKLRRNWENSVLRNFYLAREHHLAGETRTAKNLYRSVANDLWIDQELPEEEEAEIFDLLWNGSMEMKNFHDTKMQEESEIPKPTRLEILPQERLFCLDGVAQYQESKDQDETDEMDLADHRTSEEWQESLDVLDVGYYACAILAGALWITIAITVLVQVFRFLQ